MPSEHVFFLKLFERISCCCCVFVCLCVVCLGDRLHNNYTTCTINEFPLKRLAWKFSYNVTMIILSMLILLYYAPHSCWFMTLILNVYVRRKGKTLVIVITYEQEIDDIRHCFITCWQRIAISIIMIIWNSQHRRMRLMGTVDKLRTIPPPLPHPPPPGERISEVYIRARFDRNTDKMIAKFKHLFLVRKCSKAIYFLPYLLRSFKG